MKPSCEPASRIASREGGSCHVMPFRMMLVESSRGCSALAALAAFAFGMPLESVGLASR